MFKVFAVDTSANDYGVVIPRPQWLLDHPEDRAAADALEELIATNNVAPNSKYTAKSFEQFCAFRAAADRVAKNNLRRTPGSSAINSVTALAHFFGDGIHIDYLTSISPDQNSELIERNIIRSGIKLYKVMPSAKAQLATDGSGATQSIIIRNKGKPNRRIIKWAGTDARLTLTPDILPVDKIYQADALALQASMQQRLGESMFDATLQARSPYAELWFAPPTDVNYGDKFSFKFKPILLHRTTVATCNVEEFLATMQASSLERGFEELLVAWQDREPLASGRQRMAWITDGKKGGYVISPRDGIEFVPCRTHFSADGSKVIAADDLGAGDNSSGGLLAARLAVAPDSPPDDPQAAFTPLECGQFAALTGALKVIEPKGAQLEDPRQSLRQAREEIGLRFLGIVPERQSPLHAPTLLGAAI